MLVVAAMVAGLAGPVGPASAWAGAGGSSSGEETLPERPTPVERLVDEARHLAADSPRVELEEMGRTAEGDPLLLLSITAEANRPRLASRPARMETIIDPRRPRGERDAAIEASLAAVWVVGSVHGDEASGSDAALLLARHLASDGSERTREILSRSVVLIELCANPSGRRRFLQHLRSFTFSAPDADPEAVEHRQMWPGGRTNHWFFDLNRDWALLTQQETRARVAAWLRWRPQVVIDLHEMGSRSSYFFPPSAEPMNPLLPSSLGTWLEDFGRANARAFDREGLDYYVGEDFDLFYPGYGDSWPSLNGAVGMTYEQGTSRGIEMRTPTGVRRYEDAVRGHFTAALATCRHAAARGPELLRYQAAFFDQAMEEAGRRDEREYLIDGAVHPAEARRLATLLAAQGIEVWRIEKPLRVKVSEEDGGGAREHRFAPGSFRIPLRQPAYPLLESLLRRELPIDEDFLEEERTRRDEGLPLRFYDVTSWSLALSHGLTLYRSRRELSGLGRRLEEAGSFAVSAAEPLVSGSGTAPGLEVGAAAAVDTAAAHAAYGYLIPYRDSACPAALAFLWKKGVRVHTARETFHQGGIDYPAGSLVVKRRAQDEDLPLDAVMAEAAARTGARVHPTGGAWTDEGPSLGSNRVVLLKPPRVAVAVGPPLNPSSVGAVLWLLREETGLEATAVPFERLGRMHLREWDVIVLADMRAGDRRLPEHLRQWVELGGTLVAEAGAVKMLTGVEDWLHASLVEDLGGGEEDAQGDSLSAKGSSPSASEPQNRRSMREPGMRPERTPGAILRLELAKHHFLNFSAGPDAHALVLSDRLLQAGDGDVVAASYDAFSPRVAGFVWPEMEEALAGRAWSLSESHGQGKVVLFAEETAFRGSWPVTERMLLNAVLWGPSLGR